MILLGTLQALVHYHYLSHLAEFILFLKKKKKSCNPLLKMCRNFLMSYNQLQMITKEMYSHVINMKIKTIRVNHNKD